MARATPTLPLLLFPVLGLTLARLACAASGQPGPQDDGLAEWKAHLRSLLKECQYPGAAGGLTGAQRASRWLQCAQRRTFEALDRALARDVIPLAEGVELVGAAAAESRGLTDGPEELDFGTPDLVRRLCLRSMLARKSREQRDSKIQSPSEPGGWAILRRLSQRLGRILDSYMVRIDLERMGLFGADPEPGGPLARDSDSIEGRGRRKRKGMQMMSMMMMGLMLMGSVLIPMGFQFLAVLGGKALILAKMALMLSSIQGLKRVATSGVNYGLYQTHPVAPDNWHERSTGPQYVHELAGPPTGPVGPISLHHHPAYF